MVVIQTTKINFIGRIWLVKTVTVSHCMRMGDKSVVMCSGGEEKARVPPRNWYQDFFSAMHAR